MRRRFVLLLHETPDDYQEQTHWDLMFETKETLITWTLTPRFSTEELQKIVSLDFFESPVKRRPDHRLAYLDYEGPVSRNRGSVLRLDSGMFEELETNAYRVHGNLLCGTILINHFTEDGLAAVLTYKGEQ